MFGLNYPGQATDKTQNYNTNAMVNPLRGSDNFTVEEWFAHGAKKYPPVKGQFMELVAGSKMTFELGCNRAFTMQRNPADTKPLPEYSCDVSQVKLSLSTLLLDSLTLDCLTLDSHPAVRRPAPQHEQVWQTSERLALRWHRARDRIHVRRRQATARGRDYHLDQRYVPVDPRGRL
jgi:hypothetical protein